MNSFYDEIKCILTDHEVARSYAKMTIFLLISSVCYNLLILPVHLVAGGTAGLGVLFDALFGIDSSLTLFIISFIMFVLAFLFLDAKQVVATLFIAFVYPLLIKATSGIGDIFLISNSQVLVIVLFSAIVNGFSQGSLFKLGFNVGGLSIIALVCYKYTKISVTLVNSIINVIVVVFGGIVLGFSNVLYALLFLIINRTVSEKVILGISSNKTFKIISDKYSQIEKFINNELKHDVTIYDTYGGYKNVDKKLLMVVIPTSEFMILRDYVKSIDKKAFIFVTDTYEVKGQDVMIRQI